MSDSRPSRRTTRVVMIAVGAAFGSVLLLLAVTAWRIASQTVDGTEGLVGQAGLLVAVLQAGVGLAVAVTTIYYAGLTREMAEGMTEAARRDRQRDTEATVNELIGSALDLAVHSGAVASLMQRSWRWYLPAPSRMRDRLLAQSQAQISAALSAIARAADVLHAASPGRRAQIDAVVDASQAVFLRSLDGDSSEVAREAQMLRDAADRMRSEFSPPD